MTSGVKGRVIKCLYKRTHNIVTQWRKKTKEKQHIATAHMSNGYPSSFRKKVTKTRPAVDREEQNHRAVAVLSYVDGVSQSL